MMDAWIDTRTKIGAVVNGSIAGSVIAIARCAVPLRNYLYPWKMMKAVESDESSRPPVGRVGGSDRSTAVLRLDARSSTEASRVVPPCGGWPAYGCCERAPADLACAAAL